MKLIDFKQLKPQKGIAYSRDHLRRKCKALEFPEPIQVSDRRIAWIEAEIDAWLADRVTERDTAARERVAAPPDADDGRPFKHPSRALPAERLKTQVKKHRATPGTDEATA